MNRDLININQGEVVSYMHNNNNIIDVPKPFSRDVFLFDTYISGASDIEEIKDGSVSLERGERLDLFRETNNKFDKNAILMKNQNGQKIGYVPREDNAVFSRLMDAGKELFCRITSIEKRGEILKIRVKIFLND